MTITAMLTVMFSINSNSQHQEYSKIVQSICILVINGTVHSHYVTTFPGCLSFS